MQKLAKDRDGYAGCHPNLEEIKNPGIIKLAERLRGNSVKETLSNVLEWQDKNIRFWEERWPIAHLIQQLCIGVMALVAALVLALLAYAIWSFPKTLFQIFPMFLSKTLWLLCIIGVLLLFIAMALAIIVILLKSKKLLNLKNLRNVFKASIPIDWFLEPDHRLGVCRDYAKLTACLLRNLYPSNKVYFAVAPGHVAAGIEIGGRTYMLDQHLPVITIEKWSDINNKTGYAGLEFIDGLNRDPVLIVQPVLKSAKNTPRLDTKVISSRMAKLLGINAKPTKGKPGFEIVLKRQALKYEDDPIVNYSFARGIKNRISNELTGNFKIARIELKQKGKDLILTVHKIN